MHDLHGRGVIKLEGTRHRPGWAIARATSLHGHPLRLGAAGVVPASVALGRAPAEVDWPGESAQLGLTLALRDALLGLLVEVRRRCGRYAALGRTAHDHCPAHGADRDLELVTGPDLAARLDGHAIHMHTPAL